MHHPSLTNRVAIVTGGSRGIGKVMTLALVTAGANVFILARSSDEIAATIKEARALGKGACEGHVADIARWEDCAAAVERAEQVFGTVEVLVNNAGLGLSKRQRALPFGAPFPFWDQSPEDVRAMVDVNLVGALAMFHAAAPKMIAAGCGRVIGISTSRPTMVRPGVGAYGPLKAALEATTLIWARELENTGVTANILLPGGPTDTPFLPGDNVGQRAKPFTAGKGPLGQEGASMELLPAAIMGPPILWLASDASAHVSGRRFVARDWDPDLAPDQAAQNAMQPSSPTPIIM